MGAKGSKNRLPAEDLEFLMVNTRFVFIKLKYCDGHDQILAHLKRFNENEIEL